MKTAARIFSIVALIVLLLAAGSAWADTHVRIVRLSYLQGDVSIDLGQGAGAERAVLNMPIVQGARLWTGNDGQAEVEFEDGSTVRITPNTVLEFVDLSLRDSGARVNTVKISGGTAYVDVPKLTRADEFAFQLPNRSITLTHSVHFRVDMDGTEARLAVFKGQLDVAGSERTVDIHKGETLTLNLNDADRYNLANNVASLAFDAWDQDRDDTLRQVAFNRNGQLYPYGYGYADLMNYGSFTDIGGYGSCWRPYGVGFDWDPFDFGYWSYYPRFGYTWVSGYPWGWAPYRYGGWAWLSNAGWTWCPQYPGYNVVNFYTWNVLPAVITPPPRWHAPHPPNPSVNLPPIIPVPRQGPKPYRGGLVADDPTNKNANPADTGGDRHSDHQNGGINASHLTGNNSGSSGDNVILAPPPRPTGGTSGVEGNQRVINRHYGIDLTPPSRVHNSAGAPAVIQSPAPPPSVVRGSPVGRSGAGDRPGRIESSGASAPSRVDSPRMSPPASSPRMQSPQVESPRMSPPASAPSSGGSRSRPPQQ